MLRAVFEGVAFSIAEAARALPEFDGASTIYLAGGGSLHSKWRQLLCDVLGKRVLAVANPNASPRGAALLGAKAGAIVDDIKVPLTVVEDVQPDSPSQTLLGKAFERWQELVTGSIDHSLLVAPT
jgi:sugar (pentulose or hexulose) kinase